MKRGRKGMKRTAVVWLIGVIVLVAWSFGFSQPLRHPQSVAFSPSGTKLAISDTGNGRVLVFSLRGGQWHLTATIAPVDNPQGLAWLDENHLAVCEAGKVGARHAASLIVFRLHPLARQQVLTEFQQPVGATVWKDWLFVVDSQAKEIAAFTREGKLVKRWDSKRLGNIATPRRIALTQGGLLFIADDDGEVEVRRFDTERMDIAPHEPATLSGFWTCRSVRVFGEEVWVLSAYSGELKRTFVNDLAKPRWRVFTGFLNAPEREVAAVHSGHSTPDGQPSRHSLFAGATVPPVLALGRLGTPLSPVHDFDVAPRTGWLAVAGDEQVLLLPVDLRLPTRPRIYPSQTEALVAWETPEPAETILEFQPVGGEWQRMTVKGKRTKHRMLLQDLEPGRAYRVRVLLPRCFAIADTRSPVPKAFSFAFTFATKPPKGKTMFLRIPVAVIVYADVVNVDSLTPDAPPAPPVSRAYLDYLRHEVEKAQLFYWCNSRMKLWLDCDWFIVTKRITVGKQEPSQMDWRRDLTELLRLRDKDLSDYPAVVEITCERRWNPRTRRYEFAPSGGGTYGVDMRPGSSHFLGGHDPAWLFVHEFHHQLDSQFAESGYPEYPFNHFSITPDGFADNFGEHYNGNAWILRHWHGGDLSLWFVNRFGQAVLADDADGDGIPDDCPAVPLDEKRFGSDPTKADTDEDGLSDMDEVLAFTWVWEMLSWPDKASARAKYRLPDPRNRDTDGDGVPDGSDPLPLYTCEPIVKRQSANEAMDKPWFVVEEDDAPFPTPSEAPRSVRPLRGEIFLSHDGAWLRFQFRFNEPVALVHVQLDCQGDGYYVGADNVDIRIRPDWAAEKATVDVSVNNAASSERWPFADRSLFPSEQVQATVRRDRLTYRYEVSVAIPRTEAVGLTLRSGDAIGVAIYLQVAPNSSRWLSVFEPYRLVPLRVE